MKATERHHLKQNEFARTALRAMESLRENGRTLLLAIVAVVVLVGAVFGYLSLQRARATVEAWFAGAGRCRPDGDPAGATPADGGRAGDVACVTAGAAEVGAAARDGSSFASNGHHRQSESWAFEHRQLTINSTLTSARIVCRIAPRAS